MTHELYKRTLLGNEVVRLLNTQKASINHRLHTIFVNKNSLSAYDDKRFIMHDQSSTLPLRHKSIREDMFFWTIANELYWGSNDLCEGEQKTGQQAQDRSQQAQDCSQQEQVACSRRRVARSRRRVARSRRRIAPSRLRVARSMHGNGANTANSRKNKQQKRQPTTTIPQTSTVSNSSFNSPDPSFRQRQNSEDELEENLIYFNKLSELLDSVSSTDPACEGFILDQAVELDNASVCIDN